MDPERTTLPSGFAIETVRRLAPAPPFTKFPVTFVLPDELPPNVHVRAVPSDMLTVPLIVKVPAVRLFVIVLPAKVPA